MIYKSNQIFSIGIKIHVIAILSNIFIKCQNPFCPILCLVLKVTPWKVFEKAFIILHIDFSHPAPLWHIVDEKKQIFYVFLTQIGKKCSRHLFKNSWFQLEKNIFTFLRLSQSWVTTPSLSCTFLSFP